MTGAVKTLSGLLKETQGAIGRAHEKVARLTKAVASLEAGYDKVDRLTDEIETAAREVHDVLGQLSNNPPADEKIEPEMLAASITPARFAPRPVATGVNPRTGDPK